MARPGATTWYRTGLLLLTAATGAIDAVSYLALDRVFTGNMTGNVLFIGFAATGTPDIPLLNNTVALGGFAVGSVLGGRLVGRGHPARLTRRGAWLLASGGLGALALAVAWRAVGDVELGPVLAVTGLLAALMGAQVAAVKPIGNTDITTIVVTSTLANLTRDSRLGGGRQGRRAATDRLLAITAMGAGAGIGAAGVRWMDGSVALLLGTGVFCLGAGALVLGRVTQRREERASRAADGGGPGPRPGGPRFAHA